MKQRSQTFAARIMLFSLCATSLFCMQKAEAMDRRGQRQQGVIQEAPEISPAKPLVDLDKEMSLLIGGFREGFYDLLQRQGIRIANYQYKALKAGSNLAGNLATAGITFIPGVATWVETAVGTGVAVVGGKITDETVKKERAVYDCLKALLTGTTTISEETFSDMSKILDAVFNNIGAEYLTGQKSVQYDPNSLEALVNFLNRPDLTTDGTIRRNLQEIATYLRAMYNQLASLQKQREPLVAINKKEKEYIKKCRDKMILLQQVGWFDLWYNFLPYTKNTNFTSLIEGRLKKIVSSQQVKLSKEELTIIEDGKENIAALLAQLLDKDETPEIITPGHRYAMNMLFLLLSSEDTSEKLHSYIKGILQEFIRELKNYVESFPVAQFNLNKDTSLWSNIETFADGKAQNAWQNVKGVSKGEAVLLGGATLGGAVAKLGSDHPAFTSALGTVAAFAVGLGTTKAQQRGELTYVAIPLDAENPYDSPSILKVLRADGTMAIKSLPTPCDVPCDIRSMTRLDPIARAGAEKAYEQAIRNDILSLREVLRFAWHEAGIETQSDARKALNLGAKFIVKGAAATGGSVLSAMTGGIAAPFIVAGFAFAGTTVSGESDSYFLDPKRHSLNDIAERVEGRFDEYLTLLAKQDQLTRQYKFDAEDVAAGLLLTDINGTKEAAKIEIDFLKQRGGVLEEKLGKLVEAAETFDGSAKAKISLESAIESARWQLESFSKKLKTPLLNDATSSYLQRAVDKAIKAVEANREDKWYAPTIRAECETFTSFWDRVSAMEKYKGGRKGLEEYMEQLVAYVNAVPREMERMKGKLEELANSLNIVIPRDISIDPTLVTEILRYGNAHWYQTVKTDWLTMEHLKQLTEFSRGFEKSGPTLTLYLQNLTAKLADWISYKNGTLKPLRQQSIPQQEIIPLKGYTVQQVYVPPKIPTILKR